MTSGSQPTLDCQDCGNVVRKLTEAERQEVADRPYDFIVYCTSCRADRRRNSF